MKKLIYILLLYSAGLNAQWAVDSFEIYFSHHFDANTTGNYQRSELDNDWNNPPFVDELDVSYIIELATGGKAFKGTFAEDTHTGDPDHGFKWYAPIGSDTITEVYVSYDIMFRPGFDPVLSGKIPSWRIGDTWDTQYPEYEDGSTAGIRWDDAAGTKAFKLRGYFYGHNLVTGSGTNETTWGNAWYNPDDTENFYIWQVTEPVSYNITVRVVLNTVNSEIYPDLGNADGIFEGWINGSCAYNIDTMRYRNVSTWGLEVFRFYSAFGGTATTDVTTANEWMLIDNFYIWRYDPIVTSVVKGHNANTLGTVLNIPAAWTHTVSSADDTIPTFYPIEPQSIINGETFSNIDLASYVYDSDHAHSELTFTDFGDDNVTASIINDSIAQVTYSGWTGSDTVSYVATDPNSNADTVVVIYTVYASQSPIDYTYITDTINATLNDTASSNVIYGENETTNQDWMTFTEDNEWIRYDNIDFGRGCDYITVHASTADNSRALAFLLDSLTADSIMNISITNTGSLTSYDTNKSSLINDQLIKGVHSLYIRNHGTDVAVDYLLLHSKRLYFPGAGYSYSRKIPRNPAKVNTDTITVNQN